MTDSFVFTSLSVKEVAATYAKAHGKHGSKDTSTDNYSNFIRKKYLSIVGTPKWADLSVKREQDDEDSDDEFFRVRIHQRLA